MSEEFHKNKKKPSVIDPSPVSLINLDPAAAARSIDAVVAMANDEKDWLEEKVTIQFYNIEEPGGEGFFCFGKCTDPKRITLQHGEITELTRGDIRFIESRQTPIYTYKENGLGKKTKTLTGWKPRYQCRQVNVRIPRS